jgi:hypothetical protein
VVYVMHDDAFFVQAAGVFAFCLFKQLFQAANRCFLAAEKKSLIYEICIDNEKIMVYSFFILNGYKVTSAWMA